MNEFLKKSGRMVFLILAAGLVLRLISLNQSLWLDEATTALVSKMPLSDIFGKFLPGDFHPPFYYVLMKGWVFLFGSGEISLRIPSVICGTLIIYLTFLIAKKLFDKKTALIASALTATSGLFIYYSQEARMYCLTAFLVTLIIYLFIEKKWISLSASLAVLAMTDYVALLIIPVLWLFGRKDWKKLTLTHIPILIVFALWFPIFWRQIMGGLGTEGSAWWNILGTLSLKSLGLIPVKFILGRISFDNKIVYGLISGVSLLFYSWLIAKNILRRPLRGDPLKIIWGWLIVPILLGIVVSVKIPVLYYFRFLFCLPAFYILAAKGLSSLPNKAFGVCLILVIFINIISSGIYLFSPKFQRENWRGMAEAVGEDVVIYPSNSQKEALTYYGRGGQIEYYEDFKGGPEVIWPSRYIWQIFDPHDFARTKVESLGYNKVTELNLNGVEFWKYSLSKKYACRN